MSTTQKNNVDFKHPDWTKNKDRWNLVDDICDSENLKSYLVKMNPTDKSPENSARNDQVFERAVFTAATGYTSMGMVGKVFSKPPKIEVPSGMEYVETNIDGAGISIVQQSQDALKQNVRKGRAGLLVDMAASEGELSVKDLETNFATTSIYTAQQIINWKTMQVGSQVVTSQVVLATAQDVVGEDGFSFEAIDVRLELRLDFVSVQKEGEETASEAQWVYSIVEWRKDAVNQNGDWAIVETVYPTLGDGSFLDRIPFFFMGSEANTTLIDIAPMYDIAKVNVGHWNNSAVYEDSVFIVGQAQPWMSGLTQDVVDLMNQENMYVGSGRLLGVPPGEQFGFAQAAPNTLAKEAMTDKIGLMISLGAMIITPGSVAKNTVQAGGELLTQHSVLSLTASNVSEAYTDALGIMAEFMNKPPENVSYELNQEFIDPDVDPALYKEIVASYMSGALPAVDYHNYLKKNRLTDHEKDLETFNAEVGASGGFDLDQEGDET